MSNQYSQKQTVNKELILCLDAGCNQSYSGSGSTWTDLAGGVGNAALTSDAFTSDGARSYFIFSGSSSAALCPSTNLSAGGMTMEIIYSVTTGEAANCGTYGRMFKYSDTVISLGTYATNQFRCWVNAGGSRNSGEFAVNSSTSRYYNYWHHVAFTYDGANVKGYWDNNNSFTVAKTGALQGSAAVSVGNGDTNLFAGKVAVARLYNRALSATEVAKNFQAYQSRFSLEEATSIS